MAHAAARPDHTAAATPQVPTPLQRSPQPLKQEQPLLQPEPQPQPQAPEEAPAEQPALPLMDAGSLAALAAFLPAPQHQQLLLLHAAVEQRVAAACQLSGLLQHQAGEVEAAHAAAAAAAAQLRAYLQQLDAEFGLRAMVLLVLQQQLAQEQPLR